MANLALTVGIKDINVSTAATAFLRKCPMPQIPDPDFVPTNPEDEVPMIDVYPNTKKRVEAWLAQELLRAVNAGVVLLAQDFGQKLTDDIFLD